MDDKDRGIMVFIRDETFSTTEILSQASGLKRSAIYVRVKNLEKQGFIKHSDVPFEVTSRGYLSIWGLTREGARLAASDGYFDYFEAENISIMTIAHSISLQRRKVVAIAAGWEQWLSSRRMRQIAHKDPLIWLQVPDALAMSPKGKKVAIELERTKKTPKRYEEIMSNYCQMLLDKTIDQVIYICPEKITPAIEDYFLRVEAIFVNGRIQPVHESFRKRFHFVTYTEWEREAKNH